MNGPYRLLSFGIALCVNGAALGTVNLAMVRANERQRLAQPQPVRIVVTAARPKAAHRERHAASELCPSPKPI
ncbi:MAG: hypothetical protein OEW21_16655 [Betaproteobacteria bacterium]|nr:hypothetical protein [Betaproteobacteria bacterium]